MKMVVNTLKWDGLSYWVHLRWFFLGILAAGFLYYLIPFNWEEGIGIPVGFALLIVPAYLIYILPIVAPIHDFYYYGTAERLPNRPCALILGSKLFYGMAAALIGLALTYGIYFWLGIGNVEPIGLSVIMSFFMFTLYIPTAIVFGYLLMTVDSKALGAPGKLIAVGVLILLVASGFTGFFDRYNILAAVRAGQIVAFVVMFAFFCRIYDKKADVGCRV